MVRPTRLDGVLLIEPTVHRDARGLFVEAYHREHYRDQGIMDDFVQDNHSRSRRNVLRGFHYQDETAPMAKLVRCVSGRILDVVVDLRAGSPTFGRWVGAELDGETLQQIFIPAGFGHAILVLSDTADVEYKCSAFYSPKAEGCVLWSDPEIGVDWPVKAPIVSARDAAGARLQVYAANPAYRVNPAS